MAKLHLRGVRAAQVGALLGGGGGNDETDNETVKSKRFRENEDKNHTDVELGLLGVGADTGVTDDANGETGGEGGHTDGETSAKMGVSGVGRVDRGGIQLTVDDDGGNQTVDTQHTYFLVTTMAKTFSNDFIRNLCKKCLC